MPKIIKSLMTALLISAVGVAQVNATGYCPPDENPVDEPEVTPDPTPEPEPVPEPAPQPVVVNESDNDDVVEVKVNPCRALFAVELPIMAPSQASLNRLISTYAEKDKWVLVWVVGGIDGSIVGVIYDMNDRPHGAKRWKATALASNGVVCAKPDNLPNN